MTVVTHPAVLRAAAARAPLAPASPRTLPSAAYWLCLTAIAWGAAAFGAVYPWAYWPLAGLCIAAGVAAIMTHREAAQTSIGLRGALAAVVVAALLQVVPLPFGTLGRVSPATAGLLADLDPSTAAGLTTSHALSIDPGATITAVALFVSFAILLLGAARMLSARGARRVVEGLTIVAVLLALAGIVQKPLYAGRIFGFWTPEQEGTPFGPFVNRNHFAGWMLLAMPLTLSLLAAGITHAMRGIRPGWRHRVLWLSSSEANVLILLAAAIVVMSLSLVMTMSRSGMTALALAILLTGCFIVRSGGSRTRRATAWAYLVLLVAVSVTWAGTDAIAARFSQTDWSEFNTRRGAWTDAWNIAKTFPLAGTGLNTYGTATLFYQQHDLTQHYAQAHSDYLQLAAEGGIMLVLPAFAALVFFVRDVVRRFAEDDLGSTAWWLRGGAVTALLAVALQESVDFSLQMPGNVALFAIVCAVALHQPRTHRRVMMLETHRAASR